MTTGIADRAGALRIASYPLELADSPQAFALDGDGGLERANAVWLGSEEALERLGLQRGSVVEVMDLAGALQGQHVVTGEQVRSPGWRKVLDAKRQPVLDRFGDKTYDAVVNSYDLTFSAPKSVSVLWSQADAVLRGELEQAMVDASNAALEHVTRTRLVVGGTETASGFVASAAVHVMARVAGDESVPAPQLHVHAHLVGVLDGLGRLRTPHSEALFKNQAMREAGAVARARLAQRLVELGFSIRAQTGKSGRYFEIDGVDDGLCERMSGRTREVKAWEDEQRAKKGLGFTDKDAARGGLLTRRAKAKHDARRVKELWDHHAREFDFGPARIQQLLTRPAQQRGLDDVREVVRRQIVDRIWREGPTVSLGEVRSIAFELAPLGLSVAQTRELLASMQKSGELIAVGNGRVTAAEIRTSEQRVLAVAVAGARDRRGGLGEESIAVGIDVAQRSLGNGARLDAEQVKAVRMLTDGSRLGCLTGRAGTGKGPVLEAVAEAHRRDGFRVIAGAIDGATTQRLGKQIGAKAYTLEQIKQRVKQGSLLVDGETLIVIEEASKVGLRQWKELAELLDKTKAKLIVVGDVGQIGAIECPGIMDVLLEHAEIPTARLHEVRRHQDPQAPGKKHRWMDDFQAALYDGRSQQAIDILRREEAVSMHPDRQAAMRAMVDRWDQRLKDEKLGADEAILVVHGSNDDVDAVNVLAQQRRRAAGKLEGQSVAAVDRTYRLYKNDVVMLREAGYQPATGARVENGTVGVVTGLDADRGRAWVSFEEPDGQREVMIDLDKLRSQVGRPGALVASLRLAYAAHPFPLQGATYRYVAALWGHVSQRLEETYSGSTRAKNWLEIFVDAQSTGLDVDDDRRYANLARRLKDRCHRRASITMAQADGIDIAGAKLDTEKAPRLPLKVARSRALDPLEAYAPLFGSARMALLQQHYEVATVEMALADERTLITIRNQGTEALGQLDRKSAVHVRELEDARQRLAEHHAQTRARAAELASEAKSLSRRGDKLMREQALNRADIEAAAASTQARTLARTGGELHHLRRSGRHPDDWITEHGEAFARGLAAQRALGPQRAAGTRQPSRPDLGLAV